MISVAVVNGRGLIFDVDSISTLREKFRICGVLTGVLPQFPQQNIFMGLPLELLPEELKYLLDHNVVDVFDGEKAYEALCARPDCGSSCAVHSTPELGPADVVHMELQTAHISRVSGSPNGPPRVKKPQYEAYRMYEYLHDSGFYIMPGLRFGCHFMAYPGDVSRYHSHHNAVGLGWTEPFDVLDIVSGGRLGTAVKKCWVVGAANPTGPYRAFCVEWAGFG